MDYKDKQLNELSLPADDVSVEPSAGLLPSGEVDKEGAMAKADLVKLSTYSYKLFKQLEDDTQLEAWVQAKITKAADYIATVYHHIAFEMKLNDYGHKLENSDMLSESQREVLTTMLAEGRKYVAELKKAQAAKMSDSCGSKNIGFDDASKTQPDFKGKLKPVKMDEAQLDELSKTTLKSYAKQALPDLAMRSFDAGHSVGSGDFEDDKGNYSDEYKEANRKATNRKKGIKRAIDKLDEAKPSTGLTKKQKSNVVKKAKAGKDIGKKGKGFEKVAKKAAKTYGSKEKGEKVAAASMWKNIKRTVKEGIFDPTSPYSKEPSMAALLKFRKDYEGSPWERQIEYRIEELTNRFEQGLGAPQDAKGNPIKILTPEEWAKKHPQEMQKINSGTSIGHKIDNAIHTASDAVDTVSNAYNKTTKAVGDTIDNISNAYDATTQAGKAAADTFNKVRKNVKESVELSAIKKLSGLL
jgi:hypothetical protein